MGLHLVSRSVVTQPYTRCPPHSLYPTTRNKSSHSSLPRVSEEHHLLRLFLNALRAPGQAQPEESTTRESWVPVSRKRRPLLTIPYTQVQLFDLLRYEMCMCVFIFFIYTVRGGSFAVCGCVCNKTLMTTMNNYEDEPHWPCEIMNQILISHILL